MSNIHYVCATCQSWWLSKETLDYHMIAHSGKQHVCFFCPEEFHYPDQMSEHLQVQHAHNMLTDHFVCSHCGCKYSDPRDKQACEIRHNHPQFTTCFGQFRQVNCIWILF
jgi:hypothetical protein